MFKRYLCCQTVGYDINFWYCLWQGGWNLKEKYHCVQKCLLQQDRGWVGIKYEEQENNLGVNTHRSGLDPMHCSMVFLGNEILPLSAVVLISGPQTSTAFIWVCPIPPSCSVLIWAESILSITPKLGFHLVPLLGFGRKREKYFGFLLL